MKICHESFTFEKEKERKRKKTIDSLVLLVNIYFWNEGEEKGVKKNKMTRNPMGLAYLEMKCNGKWQFMKEPECERPSEGVYRCISNGYTRGYL